MPKKASPGNALATVEPKELARNEESGQFISKKSKTFEEQRKERVQTAITQVGDILNASDLEIKEGDSVHLQLLKTLCKDILETDPAKGGLGAKAKALEMLHKSLGIGSVDKNDAERAPFTVVILPPMELMNKEVRNADPPPQKPKAPSWITAQSVPDSQRTIEGEYVRIKKDSA